MTDDHSQQLPAEGCFGNPLDSTFGPVHLRLLRRRLVGVACSLRSDYGFLLGDHFVAEQASQFFTSLLVPKRRRGRPKYGDVSEALRLEAEGIPRSQIYARLGKGTKDEQRALRGAMRMRKHRLKGRDKS